MKKYEFTYKITKIDMHSCDVLTVYTPTDPRLTSYTFNVSTAAFTEEEPNKTIEQFVIEAAPHVLWQAQEVLLERNETILNKTETVNPNV